MEIQCDLFPTDNSTIFNINFEINQKTDHAGIGLFLKIYTILYFHIQLYDHRHWDRKEHQWEDPEKDIQKCLYY